MSLRTIVPLVVGLVVTGLVALNIEVDEDLTESINALAASLTTAVYYIVAAWLERNVSPKFGWLLGVAKTPAYEKAEEH